MVADFDVNLRVDYRDVARLALDCRPFDFELDSVGNITRWRNSAPAARTSSEPRFGDLMRGAGSGPRPTVGGGAIFVRAELDFMRASLNAQFGSSQTWTIGYEVYPSAAGAAEQHAILSSNSVALKVWRKKPTNFGYEVVGPGFVAGVGDLAPGSHLLCFEGSNLADQLRNNVTVLNNGAAANFGFLADPTQSLFVGRSPGGDFLGGEIRALRIWNRSFAPRERDFVFKSMQGGDFSVGIGADPRATVQVRSWLDGTGDLSLRQARRVNPTGGRQQTFIAAVVPPGEVAAILQLACETYGTVKPDSELGGDLYTAVCIERPSVSDPVAAQDAGWSSVFDLRVAVAGHYTYRVTRPNHGSMYVHFDVEFG